MRHLRISARQPWPARLTAHKSIAGLAVIAAAGTVAVAAGCGQVSAQSIGPRPAAASYAAPAACKSGTCWVAVSVATVWVKPWYPRAIDKPALGNPASPGTWVRNMTVAQKRWLVGRLETQALYGTKVIVTGHWNNWTHVAIPSQPTNRDSRGYPGWVPTAQLTRTAPATTGKTAIIRASSAWLWSGSKNGTVAGSKVMMASYDTTLPVVRTARWYVEVKLIGGRVVTVRSSEVTVHTWANWGLTRAKVVAEARRFLGLAYLWAGTSGYGFDCSGFTYSIYRAYNWILSRDADQQAVHGTAVARGALQPGDLVFYRGSNGVIGHVGLYIGGGKMIDAPGTGYVIRYDPVGNYSSARRYIKS